MSVAGRATVRLTASASRRNSKKPSNLQDGTFEIKSPWTRLVQSDPLGKEFARFFNFAVVRHHIGGRTKRTCVQYCCAQEAYPIRCNKFCNQHLRQRTRELPIVPSERGCDRLWRFLIDFGRGHDLWPNRPRPGEKTPYFSGKTGQVATQGDLAI